MSAVLAPNGAGVQDRWRSAVPALLLSLVGILLVQRETALAIVAKWSHSATFTHAFAVVPIVAWLVWRRRAALAAHQPRPNPWLLLAIAGLSLLWFVGELAAVNAITQFALVAMLVVVVPAVIGIPAAREIQFPLAFAFFAVPIGDFLLPTMMSWTADFTTAALRLTGIPVYRQGQQIVIPTGTWSVVEACAGLRYLIASLMMGSLFAYLNYSSRRRRLAFLVAAIVVPIVANWLRAYLIVLLGHYTNNQLAAGADHLIYGWIFFGVILMATFLVGARWAEAQEPPKPRIGAPDPSGVPAPPGWGVGLSAVALALLPQLVLPALERFELVGEPMLRVFAPADGWHPLPAAVLDWRPAVSGAAAESEGSYAGNGGIVSVHIAYYRHQDRVRKLVSETNKLVPSDDKKWLQTASAHRVVDIRGTPTSFATEQFRPLSPRESLTDERLVAWQVYWVDGHLTASDVQAKAYGALYRMLGRGDDAARIVVYTVETRPGAGDALIGAFVRDNLRLLDEQLRETRDGVSRLANQ